MNDFNALLTLVLLAAASEAATAQALDCPPKGYDRDALVALKATQFELKDDARRQALALGLIGCLADPDPVLRDGIAFEAYSTWMRDARLDIATRTVLLTELSAWLQPAAIDAAGFRRPFAALVLAEVARTDRLDAWLSAAQRAALVDTATRYVESIRDYRGFDDRDGWRHGVAHGADLLTQLALNPALHKAQLDRLLAAVASQVAPQDAPAYIEGESARLARPVLFVAQRGLHARADWDAWFAQLTAPAPLGSWAESYSSRAGLARRHNLTLFLFATYVGARESGDARFEVLVPSLQSAFKTLQ